MSDEAATGGWRPAGRIDLTRLPATTLAQGAAALLLFLALQLPWYTFSTSGATGSASAMVAGGWRWLIWLISLATVVSLLLRAVTSWRDPSWLGDEGRRRQLMAGVAGLDFVLVLIAAFGAKGTPPHVVPLPNGVAVGSAVGAYLAVVLALAVLVAAVMEIIEASPRGGSASTTARRAAAAARPATQGAPLREQPGGAPRQSAAPAPGALGPARRAPASQRPAEPGRTLPPQRPAEPGTGPPTGWMPPLPPPPPPL